MQFDPIDVLTTPFLSVTTNQTDSLKSQPQLLSLPELYSALMADRVACMTALRPHQKHALHAFLVQVGALALVAAKRDDAPTAAEDWRSLLAGLTPNFPGNEPWSLVVEDLSKPALLQPPVPEGRWEVLKEIEPTPDALDVIPYGRQHDLKSGRMRRAGPDSWFYALLSVQTISAQNGAPNKAAARSPSGNAFRSFVGISPANIGFGAQIRRDIERLCYIRSEIYDQFVGYSESGGLGLVWLEPWDGVQQLDRSKLDAFYVEICRRIRLASTLTGLVAHRTGSDNDRIREPDGLEGLTGDPWTPILNHKQKYRPFVIYDDGLSYSRVASLFDGARTQQSPLQCPASAEGKDGMVLLLRGIGIQRGKQGVSASFHERQVFVPQKAVSILRQDASKKLGGISIQRVEDARGLVRDVLAPALAALFGNSSASDKKSEPYLAAFDREIDAGFFEALFEEVTLDDHDAKADARRRWLLDLKSRAEDILATAEAGSPLSLVRRYQARAAAHRVLQGAFLRVFADKFPAQEKDAK